MLVKKHIIQNFNDQFLICESVFSSTCHKTKTRAFWERKLHQGQNLMQNLNLDFQI